MEIMRAPSNLVNSHSPAPFIVGAGRSGTTLLRMMLDSHPEMSIPPETNFIRTLYRGLPEQADPHGFFLSIINRVQGWNDFGVGSPEFADQITGIRPFDLGKALRTFYALYASRFGKRRWGDKTPANLPDMEVIQSLLPEARFIHMIRDGRDVALSLREVWFGPETLEESARAWVWTIAKARSQRPNLRHYLEIRYEVLLRRPEETLQRICAFLDLPWTPALLLYHRNATQRLTESRHDYHGPNGRVIATAEQRMAALWRTTSPPDTGRIDRWRREMDDRERAAYESIAGSTLRDLGYELE